MRVPSRLTLLLPSVPSALQPVPKTYEHIVYVNGPHKFQFTIIISLIENLVICLPSCNVVLIHYISKYKYQPKDIYIHIPIHQLPY